MSKACILTSQDLPSSALQC